ncbi:MAG: flagellar motor protein MotD [Nevskia sp.]|nr:flagellar motor protein MotD [Nevskia sp.]
MARRRAHEEHANHEAWAIPYGDLVTLLLALFVVLYSMSSVNEGKYRVLSDSLNEAFGGRPRSPSPIQIGDNAQRGSAPSLVSPVRLPLPSYGQPRGGERDIRQMAAAMTKAMGALIDRKLVTVRANGLLLEIEIRADILFPSGVAAVSERARPVLTRVASVLAPFPSPVRIEGHTDNVPVATAAFPSNWQLSSARAASVVALFVADGVDPRRLSVAGFGEFRPKAPNTSAEGRNANRRVLIVVQGSEDGAAAAQTAAAGPLAAPAPPEAAAANPPPADVPVVKLPTLPATPVYSAADAAADEMVGNLLESELVPHADGAAASAVP